jgi:quinol monooxygenase YgiN
MSAFQAVAKFRIQPGKAEEFKRLAAESLAIVKEKDTGTTRYDWFLNEAETECLVLETYESAEALLTHSRNVGRLVGQVLQISECSVDMLADPTPEVRAALKRLPMTLYGRLLGLD